MKNLLTNWFHLKDIYVGNFKKLESFEEFLAKDTEIRDIIRIKFISIINKISNYTNRVRRKNEIAIIDKIINYIEKSKRETISTELVLSVFIDKSFSETAKQEYEEADDNIKEKIHDKLTWKIAQALDLKYGRKKSKIKSYISSITKMGVLPSLIFLSIIVLSLVVLVLVLLPYVNKFSEGNWDFRIARLSGDPFHWGAMGDYFGGLLNPIFSLFSFFAIIFLTYSIFGLESRREILFQQLESSRVKQSVEPRCFLQSFNYLHIYSLMIINVGLGTAIIDKLVIIKADDYNKKLERYKDNNNLNVDRLEQLYQDYVLNYFEQEEIISR